MLHLFVGDIACSPNVMVSNVSASVCQKCPIFYINLKDSYLSSISLILHRCCRAMDSMVLRTWRSCMAHNVYDFQYIFHILLFAHVRCFKILLLANVRATFLKCINKCGRQQFTIFLQCQFRLMFPMIFIDFMLSSFDVILATLQNMQRTCCDLKRSKPPMSTKPHCA